MNKNVVQTKQVPKGAGFIVVVAGPTGVGETTVTNAVLRHLRNAQRLVTTTSRTKRPGERDGREYHFMTKSAFRRGVQRGYFLEHIYIRNRGVYYGTHRATIERALARGTILFANLELKGLRVMRRVYPMTLAIFLKPESLAQIVRRKLQQHPTITKRELAQRLTNARAELKEAKYYDAVVVNKEGRLSTTVAQVTALIRRHAKEH